MLSSVHISHETLLMQERYHVDILMWKVIQSHPSERFTLRIKMDVR